MVPRIGTQFAGYRIEALLGRGGMAVVYGAENPRLGIRVALKVLAPELSDDEAFREQFVRESRLAAALNHPGIITIYDAGEADGSLFIAMRYVAGDLRETLRRDGPLPLTRALPIVGQVADALDAAHAERLVHRDVKPGNILLDAGAAGGPERAYLADFGLTKHVGSTLASATSGRFVGTIDYMAPEQIESGTVDGRADLYSLGCVAFECLTGSPPFPRETDAAVLWAHMKEPPPRASERGDRELPAAVDDAIWRALEKEPAARFDSCVDLVAALRAGAEGGPGRRRRRRVRTAAAGAPATGARQATGGPRRALALAAAALVGAGAAAVAVLLALDPAEPAERVVTQVRTVAPPAPEFTAFDEEVRRLVPVDFRESCTHAEPITSAFDSTLTCRPGKGVQRVRYSHARSGTLLNDHFRQRVEDAGVSLTTTEKLSFEGDCGESDVAVQEWILTGRTGHDQTNPSTLEESSSAAAQRLLGGRVLCHGTDARSWVEWTDARLGVYAIAYGRDGDRVVDWWRTAAGPHG
jgi:serine/threonine-protein kinase